MTRHDPIPAYRHWPHRGGTLEEMTAPETTPLPLPAPDEVIARVEAVSICSSDLKVIRMGASHPLFGTGGDTVLGHEVCLRVHSVGADQTRFRVGQRLGLQPAMRVGGKRRIIGMDQPGGFAQYLRLGPEALAEYVFDVPEDLTAASIAMLEPYGCVERAYGVNARRGFLPSGDALVVTGPGWERYRSAPLAWQSVTVLGEVPDFVTGTQVAALPDRPFDDIIALGEIDAGMLAALPPRLAIGGMLLQARRQPCAPVPLDLARVHYDALAFTGTNSADLADATARFEAKAGGTALIHGAGGAMGRIHVHRLLQLDNGPRTVIATSRKGQRLRDLEADFGPLAKARGRVLKVVDVDNLARTIAELPEGLDDIHVIAPNPDAVAEVAPWLATGGLVAVFAGFPYGQAVDFDLSRVATDGLRITGSTGCSVADMQDVLARVRSGDLDLTANMKAVAGLDALPQALAAVSSGSVSGKIVIYPHSGLPLTRLTAPGWTTRQETGLT